MKLFFDTEFTGLHKNTTLISIAIISEDNRCFYAKLTDYDSSQVNSWIQENVINNLEISDKIKTLYDVYEVEGTKEDIRSELLYWIGTLDDNYFELVSDVCHYDMVLFVDLFGTAFDLPEFINPCCYDINQDIYYSCFSMSEAFDTNREELLKQLVENSYDDTYYELEPIINMSEDNKHNALWDAIIIKCLYKLLNPMV